jgi:hypothetical protein
MSTHSHHKVPEISSAAFPALAEFLRGYFHEDLLDDYGSPQGAARQFLHDADDDQRRDVANEWMRFLRQTKGLGMTAINEALSSMGSACLLTESDVKKVTAVLNSNDDF